MESEKITLWQQFMAAWAMNPQRKFGTYAAELSFYIIWAIIPLLLTLANIISILPFSTNEIVPVIEQALPEEIQSTIMPILEGYIDKTSTSALSLGLIVSLWPASNVFNTIQRIMDTVFKAPPKGNALLSRAFAYVFTLATVVIIFLFAFVIVFGSTIMEYIGETFHIQLPSIIDTVLNQGMIIGMGSIFFLMFSIYQYMPNLKWHPRYALVGALTATTGFIAVSQLFGVYLSFSRNVDTNTAIGLFIVAVIWLYFNMMAIAGGAYVAVLYHDFCERDYWEMKAKLTAQTHLVQKHPDFIDYPYKTENILKLININKREGIN